VILTCSSARAEQEAEKRRTAEAERARLDVQPLRRFEGNGAAFLPAYLFDWLTDTEPESFNVTDLAVLAILMMALEQAAGAGDRPGVTVTGGSQSATGRRAACVRPPPRSVSSHCRSTAGCGCSPGGEAH
jgi:hypothetical protein